jgi:DNA recombination protein RmuC
MDMVLMLVVGGVIGVLATLAALRPRMVSLQRDLAEERSGSDERMARLLKASGDHLLQLANETLGRQQVEVRSDLEQRQKAVAEMVRPLTESLTRVDARLEAIDRDRVQTSSALQQQLRTMVESQDRLRSETGSLVAALRKPQTRGRWGEMQLRNVVEMAGMVAYSDFTEQATVHGDDRTLRPDLVVRLPGGKHVVVDAKAPLQAFLDAYEAGDDAARQGHMQTHARLLRDHVRKLAAKSYWSQFDDAPDFVLLFLPGEHFLNAALEVDPGLIELGVEQQVLIATPTTLIALLRAVHYGWQQEKVAENAREISALGRDLHGRLGTVAEHVSALGRKLTGAVDSYNKAVGSLETRVLVSARRFADHGAVGPGAEITELEPIDKQVRALQAPELVEVVSAARDDAA